MFLHDPLAGRIPDGETFDPQSKDAEGKLIPPSISALFGMYTENDTWMAGGAHLGIWKNDNIRYTGALATGSININFYRNILGRDITMLLLSLPWITIAEIQFSHQAAESVHRLRHHYFAKQSAVTPNLKNIKLKYIFSHQWQKLLF